MSVLELKGYQAVVQIATGLNSRLFRAIRKSDEKEVLLKLAKSDPPTEEEAGAIDHEISIIQQLAKSPSVPKLHDISRFGISPVIVAEFIPWPKLHDLLEKEGRLPLADFLDFALAAVEALENIHRYDVIHKDFNIYNLLYNKEEKKCAVVDFGLSVAINHQKTIPVDPRFLEGTIAYMSPEQTGRMNRGIDYRSDYYSLGVTLFEAITGELPFISKDPLETIHAHMAQVPSSPSSLLPEIPDVVSSIILKLMEKEPEGRYQSIAGIRSDLKSCQENLRDGKISPFPIAAEDTHERFSIPEKIYGRDREIKILFSLYERVMKKGSGFITISGDPGIGKTSLVQEIYKPIFDREGLIFSGKFEQFKRNIPYFALAQALGKYIAMMLSEPKREFLRFKKRLLHAVGKNGRVIIDIIPSVEKVIGEQPPLPEVGIEENLNRFIYTFRKFVECLPTEKRPLVLFIDDLQWADAPSLKVLQMLLESRFPYLLVIGGYRKNEVDETHPLSLMLYELKNREYSFDTIEVQPLKLPDVETLIAESIYKKKEEVLPLAAVCMKKSGGNPFFLHQLLENFYKNGWIFYDWDNALWQWNLEEIKHAPFSDNVADLMIAKIRAIDEELQRLLATASCVGREFSIKVLQVLWKEEEGTLRQKIEALLKHELIACDEKHYYMAENFHFTHDRVQEAAHLLLDDKEQIVLHLQLAAYHEKGSSEKELEEKIFTIVDHYNKLLGSGELLLQEGRERREHIARLNFQAAKAAKASAAYEVSIDYCEKSLLYLETEEAKESYTLFIDIYTEAMESAYLAKEYEKMEQYKELLFSMSRSIEDRYRAFIIMGLYLSSKGKLQEAGAFFLKACSELEIFFPKNANELHVGAALATLAIKQLRTGRTIEELKDLPTHYDKRKEIYTELAFLLAPTFLLIGKPNTFALTLIKGLNYVLDIGNTERALPNYAGFGIVLSDTGLKGLGRRYGDLATLLAEECSNQIAKTQTLLAVYLLLTHWTKPVTTAVPLLMDNYYASVEAGNLQSAAYCLVNALGYRFYSGTPLDEMMRDLTLYQKPLLHLNNQHGNHHYLTLQRAMIELSLPERGYLKDIADLDMDLSNRAIFYLNDIMCAYLLRDFDRATLALVRYPDYKDGIIGLYDTSLFPFYRALIETAIYKESSLFRRLKLRLSIIGDILRMRHFASYQENNFRHKYHLMAAEWARVRGRKKRAEKLYKKAAAGAKEHGFLNEEALAYELGGRHYQERGDPVQAVLYIEKALQLYNKWGAHTKVKMLQEEFEALFVREERPQEKIRPFQTMQTTLTETIKIGAQNLDTASIQKASETISSTIVMEELLDNLMAIVIEQAGAERGLLLTEKGDEEFLLEAERKKSEERITFFSDTVATDELLLEPVLQHAVRNEVTVIVEDATEHSHYKNSPYILKHRIKSILCLPLMNKDRITAILYLENSLVKNAFTEKRYALLQYLSSQLAMAIDNAKLYRGIADLNEELQSLNFSYERFVPQDFLSLLEKKSIKELSPGDYKEREMSVLFMDIRSFTALSEAMTPQENFTFINEFIGYMEPVIRINNGFIDKYIGDAIMALFAGGADDAVTCAIDMVKALEKYNIIRKRSGRVPIRIGIGINSGMLILGTVGNEKRMDGTVISDAVNTASRVEGLTKEYGVPILITENSYTLLKDPSLYNLVAVGKTDIRGKKEKIAIYTVATKQ